MKTNRSEPTERIVRPVEGTGRVNYVIDFRGGRDFVASLPDTLDSEPEPRAADYYVEKEGGGGFELDKSMQSDMLGELDRMISDLETKRELARLRLERDCDKVEQCVREGLRSLKVKPGLFEGAVAKFLREHRFGIDEATGEVIALGKRGAAEASVACIRWMDEDEYAKALRDMRGMSNGISQEGEFSRQLRALVH